MDYKELLKKYMAHVGEQEGVYFLGASANPSSAFTPEELAELRRLMAEVDS